MTVESQRCSELLSNRLLKNSFLTEKYANIPMNLMVNFQIHGFFIILLTLWGQSPKTEVRNAEQLGSRFVLRISGFGLLSDLGFRPSDLCCSNDLRVGLERPWSNRVQPGTVTRRIDGIRCAEQRQPGISSRWQEPLQRQRRA